MVTFSLRPLSCTEKTPSSFPKKRLDKPASPVWAAEVTNKSLAPTGNRTVILRRPTHILNISLCQLSYGRTLYVCLIKAVLWLRRLDAGLTPLRIGFDLGPLCVGFVVDKVTLEKVSKLVFPPVITISSVLHAYSLAYYARHLSVTLDSIVKNTHSVHHAQQTQFRHCSF